MPQVRERARLPASLGRRVFLARRRAPRAPCGRTDSRVARGARFLGPGWALTPCQVASILYRTRRQRRNGATPAPAKKKTATARAKKAGLEVVAGGAGQAATQPKVPKADALWLASTKKQWAEFWSAPAAKKLAPALDLAAVERLFTLYDERARSLSTFRRNRLVKGSQGQVVLNPLGRQINSLNTAILQLEDRLGLSPLARLKMNIAIDDPDGDEPASLDELNESLNLDDDAFSD